MTTNNNYEKYNKNITESTVAWNQSNLFYQYLYDLDMDMKEAYFSGNWDLLYKTYKIKYMKVKVFIEKYASKDEIELLKNDIIIKSNLSKLKQNNTDFANRFNSDIIQNILDIIENKYILIEELMSKAGMNLLLNKIKTDVPSVLANDDF